MFSNLGCGLINPITMAADTRKNLQLPVSRLFIGIFFVSFITFELVATSKTGCTHLLTKSSGKIYSPGYPEEYPDSTFCRWTIFMPTHEKILLTFVTFQVEAGTSNSICDKDYVEIMDVGFKSLGKFCNSPQRYPRGTIRSTGNTVRVIFSSNFNNSRGFAGLFQLNFRKEPCGEYLTGMKGEIRSPNFPGPYPAPKECIWRIEVPASMVIKFYFLEFTLDPKSECNLDYIKVRDGFNATSRLMGHFCAKRKPDLSEVRSTGNKMWLEFKSFMPTASIGFHAFYEAEPHCGGLLKGEMGSFTSPGYPDRPSVSTTQECLWKIETEPGHIVSVVFSKFDLGASRSEINCVTDYIELYDGSDDQSKVLGRYCDKVLIPQDIRSTGKLMSVKLRRSIYTRGVGFFATYTAIDPKNQYDKCSESASELLFKCDNGNYIKCQWKCDGTDDCGDNSDENNCRDHTFQPRNSSKLRNYVIILVSITGSAVAIVLTAFIVDRLRKKRRSRARSRRRRRCPRLSPFDNAPLTDTSEPSSPPPPYDFAVSVSGCCDNASSNPPPYTRDDPTHAASTEVGASGDQLEERTHVGEEEQQASGSADLQEELMRDPTGFITTRTQNSEDAVSIGGSPPTSDTSPLIV